MVANDPGQPTLSSDAAALAPTATIDLDIPTSALAIGAHPDDIEFGAGGTLAKWANCGLRRPLPRVHRRIEGHAGMPTPTPWPSSNAAATSSARRPGGSPVNASARSSSSTASTASWRTTPPHEPRSSEAIRRLRPDVVVSHDPWKRYRLHPDHRVTGQLVCDAIVGARDPHFHRDLGLAPFRPTALMLFEADLPNHAEDVTATVERKLTALLAHESQFESTMHAKGGDPALLDAFRTRILDRLAELGEPWDLPYAEVFALMIDL